MAANTPTTLSQAPPARLAFPDKSQAVEYDPAKFNASEANGIRNAINQHADVLAALIAQQVPPAVQAFNPQFSGVYSGPRQDGTGASVVTFTRDGIDDFYSAKQAMSLALFPGGIPEPEPAGVPDEYWKLASPPTAPYQSYTVLTPAQLLRLMDDSGVNEWKLYGVLGAQGLVLVTGLTRRHVSYEAWLAVDEDTQPVRGTYDLVADEFTEGTGDSSGSSFTAAALEALMHPASQIVLEEVDGLVYGSLAAGSVRPVHLSAEMQARLNPELLRVTAAGGAATVHRTTDTLAAALTGALSGSVVHLQVPASLSQLQVKNGVRYVFGAAATTPQVLTDDGQQADAYLEFAAQYTGPRRVVVANAATRLRVYGSLSGEGEPAITATAGTVEHSGQSYSRLANLSGAARLNKWGRHACGGDTGIIAADTSVVHLYGEIQAGYERGVEASGSAQVHLHGDSAQTFGAWALAYFAFVTGSAQLHLYAGRHTSLARPYADLQTATAEIHLHPGAELPTPSEGVTIAGSGVVHLYAGCLVDETTIASTCTIVRHGTVASGGGGGGPQVVQSTGQSTTAVMSQKAVTEALASSGGGTPATDTSFCLVKVGSPNDVVGTGATLQAGIYQTVPLTQVVEDAGNNWNATTYEYTVPRNGMYLVLTEAFRLAGMPGQPESLPAGQFYYWGPGTATGPSDQLLWSQTTGRFNGGQHSWQERLTAGQKVRLVVYLDGFAAKVQARMSIRFLTA